MATAGEQAAFYGNTSERDNRPPVCVGHLRGLLAFLLELRATSVAPWVRLCRLRPFLAILAPQRISDGRLEGGNAMA